MTTPTGAADERERIPDWCDVSRKKDAGGELTALERFIHDQEPAGNTQEREFRLQLEALIVEQLAAQSAELERARKLLADVRDDVTDAFNYAASEPWRDQAKVADYYESLLDRINDTLAAPSAAGGEKEE